MSYCFLDLYEDNSFIMTQKTLAFAGISLQFGPAIISLASLEPRGYYLEVRGANLRNTGKLERSFPVMLTQGQDRYRVGRIPARKVTKCVNLVDYLYSKKPLNSEAHVSIEPLQALKRKYPYCKKPVEYIGNNTIREYVKNQLKNGYINA